MLSGFHLNCVLRTATVTNMLRLKIHISYCQTTLSYFETRCDTAMISDLLVGRSNSSAQHIVVKVGVRNWLVLLKSIMELLPLWFCGAASSGTGPAPSAAAPPAAGGAAGAGAPAAGCRVRFPIRDMFSSPPAPQEPQAHKHHKHHKQRTALT